MSLLERLALQERPGEATEPLSARWVTVDGLRMFTRFAGEGKGTESAPVVLVHGFVVSSLYMVPLAARLAREFRVYAPDLPGFGSSDKPSRVLDVAGMAEALHAWMRSAGIARASLVGNSLGCQTVTEFAARWPGQVERLVLLGPTIDPRRRSYPRQVIRWLSDALREKPSLFLVHLRDYRQAGVARALETSRCMMADRIEERLPRVEAPTLVVRGERDVIVPHGWAREAAELLPRGSLREIPGAAHSTNYDAPEEVARLIAPFLRAGG